MTIEDLAAYGADIKEGLARCMNNEVFYLRLVGMARQDQNLGKLADAVARHDLDAAFEAAHALKGVLANLALTPVLRPVSEMTEYLRNRTDMDYSDLLKTAQEEMARLNSIFSAD